MTEQGKKPCIVENNEEEQMIINQQYKQWKKEAPYKYDLALLRSLQWPSTTFQWLPQTQSSQDCDYHYAVICSNSLEVDQCQLQTIKVSIPKIGKNESFLNNRNSKIEIVDRKPLGSEINRARYCYANPALVASSHANGQIILTYKNKQDVIEVASKLICHTSQGYGLSWNPKFYSMLASGQSDKRICIWDIQKNRQQNNKSTPVMQILHHSAPVEDVAWHKMHPNIFASCSDDRLIMVWDIRFRNSINGSRKPIFEIIAHTNQVYSLDFSPFSEFLFLSGSGDQNASVWDLRNLTRSIDNYKSKGSVVKVQWNPYSVNLFATCSYDRKVNIWDLSANKKEDGNRIFEHEGHRSKVVDFDWNPNQKFLIGSTQEANCMHIWEMKKDIYYSE